MWISLAHQNSGLLCQQAPKNCSTYTRPSSLLKGRVWVRDYVFIILLCRSYTLSERWEGRGGGNYVCSKGEPRVTAMNSLGNQIACYREFGGTHWFAIDGLGGLIFRGNHFEMWQTPTHLKIQTPRWNSIVVQPPIETSILLYLMNVCSSIPEGSNPNQLQPKNKQGWPYDPTHCLEWVQHYLVPGL